jgi:hypothetical protein
MCFDPPLSTSDALSAINRLPLPHAEEDDSGLDRGSNSGTERSALRGAGRPPSSTTRYPDWSSGRAHRHPTCSTTDPPE